MVRHFRKGPIVTDEKKLIVPVFRHLLATCLDGQIGTGRIFSARHQD